MITPDSILDAIWFTAQQSVGMVAIRTGVGGWKVYVGVGAGFNADSDALHIAQHGAKVHQRIAVAAFPRFDPATYDDAHMDSTQAAGAGEPEGWVRAGDGRRRPDGDATKERVDE